MLLELTDRPACNVLLCHRYAAPASILQVAGYAGLLLATPTVLYEIVAWVFPGLTTDERKQLAPIVFGSSILFYLGYRLWTLNLPTHTATSVTYT